MYVSVAKATHAPLALACRLVAVLGTVVQPRCRFDKHVFRVRKFRDFGLRRRLARESVGHYVVGHFGTRGQRALEKPLGCNLVAALLQRNIKLGAMLIDRPPQQVRFAAQRHLSH